MSKQDIKQLKPTICNLCGGEVVFTKSKFFKSGYMYMCLNCKAKVGTFEKDNEIALGTLADSETRKKRMEVHRLFDRFWKGSTGRANRYKKLAEEMGINEEECHFAYMQMDQLLQAEKILLKWFLEKYDK